MPTDLVEIDYGRITVESDDPLVRAEMRAARGDADALDDLDLSALDPASRRRADLIRAELAIENRVRARLAVAPIRVEDGCVVIDMTRGLPSLPDAVAAVERSVMARALEIAEGNQTKAAALVGLSRSVFQYRWRTVNGLPPRPVKG